MTIQSNRFSGALLSFEVLLNHQILDDNLQVTHLEIHENEGSPTLAQVGILASLAHLPAMGISKNDQLEIRLGYDSKTNVAFKGLLYAKRLRINEKVCEIELEARGDLPDLENQDSEPSIVLGPDAIYRLDLEKMLGTKHAEELNGFVEVQGNLEAKTGDWVQIQGLGNDFDGKFMLSGTSHEVRKGSWLTTYRMGANEVVVSDAKADAAPTDSVFSDSNGNAISFFQDGIEIRSKGKITLTSLDNLIEAERVSEIKTDFMKLTAQGELRLSSDNFNIV